MLAGFTNALFLIFIAMCAAAAGCGFDGAWFRSIVLESVERLYDPPHIEHQSRLLLISVLGFMVNMVMTPIQCVPANRSAGGYIFLSRIPCTSGAFNVFALTRWPSYRALSMLVTERNCCRRWCEWVWRQF